MAGGDGTGARRAGAGLRVRSAVVCATGFLGRREGLMSVMTFLDIMQSCQQDCMMSKGRGVEAKMQLVASSQKACNILSCMSMHFCLHPALGKGL